MIQRMAMIGVVSLAFGGFAQAQLDKPLPQAMMGEANKAYETYLVPSDTPAFRMPSRPDKPIWFRADGLITFSNPSNLPPLLTTSPAGTPRTTAGIFGTPGTNVLIGGSSENSYRGGVGFALGIEPFPDYHAGLELGFSMLSGNEKGFVEASDSSRILGRPFTIAGTGQGQAILVAFPGLSSGSFNVSSNSGNLYMGNITLTDRFIDSGNFHLTGLIGYRRYDMQEELNMLQNLVSTDPNTVPGTTIRTLDRFATYGTFHGADFGLRGEFVDGPLAWELTARLAVGQLTRTVDIFGSQLINVPGAAPQVNTGGAFALVSNIGRRTNSSTQIMPELGTAVKWQISRHLEARIGYSVVVLQGVARAADQIDTTISPNNFPPVIAPQGSNPAPMDRTSNIWLQTISLGLTLGF